MGPRSVGTYTPRQQSGTTLVEVLVAVVVASVGLLGLAGLQVASVQNTNSATQRFEATILAHDILERMRANRRQAAQGAYDIDIGEAAGGGAGAGDDLAAWKAALTALPDGDGAIETNDRRTTVTVRWTDASSQNPDGSRVAVVRLRSEL